MSLVGVGGNSSLTGSWFGNQWSGRWQRELGNGNGVGDKSEVKKKYCITNPFFLEGGKLLMINEHRNLHQTPKQQ